MNNTVLIVLLSSVVRARLYYLLFLLLWYLRGRTRREGELFLVYIIAFAFNRFIVEFFRANPTAFGPLSVAHVTAIGMAAAALITLLIRRNVIRGRETLEHRLHPPRPTLSDVIPYIVVPVLMVGSVLTYYGIYR